MNGLESAAAALEPAAASSSESAGPSLRWRRTLGLLWLGQVVSHLGDSLFLVGIFFLALDVTGSKSLSGLLVAVNFLPALAFGLYAGAIVDRYDRRKIMIVADLVRGFAVGAIPLLHLSHNLGAAALGIAMFALATGGTLFNPALKSFLPESTPPGHLTSAVTLFQISEFAALVAGPALAAVALSRLGSVHLFSLDAATFFLSAGCLAALPASARAPARAPVRRTLAAIHKEITSGLREILSVPALRVLLLLVAADNLITVGLLHVATPLLIKESLGLGAAAYAQAQTFYFLGMVAASSAFWLWGRNVAKGRTILLGLALDGLTFIPLAYCHTLGQVQVALFVHAFAIPLIVIPRTVLIQQQIPGPLHGRAFALLQVVVFGMMAISSGVVGILAESVAPRTLFIVLGAFGVLPGLAGFWFRAVTQAR